MLFCAPCREMACVLCAYGDHKGHPVSLLSEAAVELCRKQEEYSGNLESEAELLLKTSETLRQELKRLEENSIAAKAFLASKVQSVLDTIQQFNQQMLERIDSEYHAKRNI